MTMMNFILIISTCTLYIIPTESRHGASYFWIDCATNYMGPVECGETVQGFTSIDPPDVDNWYNVWTFSVIGSDDCEITFSFCNEFTNYEAAVNVHDTETYDVVFDALVDDIEEECPSGSYPEGLEYAPTVVPNITFNATTCTPYYLRVGATIRTAVGPYALTVTCSDGCTPCTLDEAEDGEEDDDDDDESGESSESVDDAKADIAERELPDDEMFGYTEEDGVYDGVDNNNEYSKEVTLRFADKVWESIYGVMIVLMVCCGLFCYLFSRTNKQ